MRWLLAITLFAACNSSSSAPSPLGGTPGTPGKPAASGAKWMSGGDVPIGVWVGMDADRIYDPNHFHDSMRIRAYAFWPDGHFNKGLPAAGLANLDLAAYERDHPTNPYLGGEPGTWKANGDGTWTLTYNGSNQVPLTHQGDELVTRQAHLYPAKDVTGAVLDGTYTWNTDTEDPYLGQPGCRAVVVFTRDGTFDDRGGFATPCKTSGPDAPGTGTYELRDFSLVMHYSDGRTAQHVITPIVNGDLHKDNSRAIIMYQLWSRRTAPIAAASAPSAPAPAAPAPPTPAPAAPSTNSGETAFDAVVFATPVGDVQRNSSSIRFSDAPDNQVRCMTFVYAGLASTGDPKRDFATDWKDLMLNGRSADTSPAPDAAKSPNGLVFTVAGSMTTEASNGARVYRALFVFEVAGKRVDVVMIAPTEAGLANCHVEDFIKSIRPA